MANNRTGPHDRRPLRVYVGVVQQIIGHQIYGAFHPFITAADTNRKGPEHGGLADTDITFQQDMPAREYGDQYLPDNGLLA